MTCLVSPWRHARKSGDSVSVLMAVRLPWAPFFGWPSDCINFTMVWSSPSSSSAAPPSTSTSVATSDALLSSAPLPIRPATLVIIEEATEAAELRRFLHALDSTGGGDVSGELTSSDDRATSGEAGEAPSPGETAG